MSDSKSSSAAMDEEAHITLGLLNAIHENSAMTQRSMAKDLGIALGLANAYLKRCVRKGLVKVQQVPANRYAYYLTPQGFAEKSQLTARYLSMSFDFFRHARTQCGEVYTQCAQQGWRRIALAGVGDLGEIATLCARDAEVDLVGFLDAAADTSHFAGLPVAVHPDELGAVDAIVVTDLGAPQETFERMTRLFAAERVLAPRLLHVSRQAPR
ncbi:MAG: winged helix-turn-helix transcriptional regulator [Magnetospirillum sp. WYHS-4]